MSIIARTPAFGISRIGITIRPTEKLEKYLLDNLTISRKNIVILTSLRVNFILFIKIAPAKIAGSFHVYTYKILYIRHKFFSSSFGIRKDKLEKEALGQLLYYSTIKLTDHRM